MTTYSLWPKCHRGSLLCFVNVRLWFLRVFNICSSLFIFFYVMPIIVLTNPNRIQLIGIKNDNSIFYQIRQKDQISVICWIVPRRFANFVYKQFKPAKYFISQFQETRIFFKNIFAHNLCLLIIFTCQTVTSCFLFTVATPFITQLFTNMIS